MVTTRERAEKTRAKRANKPKQSSPRKKATRKPTKKKATRKKKIAKKVDSLDAILSKDLFEADMSSQKFLGAVKVLKDYIKDNPFASGSTKDIDEEPKVHTEIRQAPIRNGRNISDIAHARGDPKFTPEYELGDEFFKVLSAKVDGAYVGGSNIKDVLGDRTFDSIEKQMADAYLDSLRSNRRMRILNKLLNTSYELIEDNLSIVLKTKKANKNNGKEK